MYVDVLVPVAIGDVEENPALDRARSLAEQDDATLHLLSVVDSPAAGQLAAETGRIHEGLDHALLDSVTENAVRTAEGPALTDLRS
jgi:nucleotide-binding universal stress UspA family protein